MTNDAVALDLFFNFSLPSPTIVEILQFLVSITVLIHFPVAVQTIGMICGMVLFAVVLEHFEGWGSREFFVACKTEELLQWRLFTKSCVHCIDMLTIFTIASRHFWPYDSIPTQNLNISTSIPKLVLIHVLITVHFGSTVLNRFHSMDPFKCSSSKQSTQSSLKLNHSMNNHCPPLLIICMCLSSIRCTHLIRF